MALDLAKLPLVELLRKFGAGGHKPGSGSAAALLGLISCALTRTVIDLTKQRDGYKEALAELDSIEASITNDIEPELWGAFDEDSIQFDKVITARRARNAESDPAQRWKHGKQALDELHVASEIPLDIAEKCLALAEHAITVFDIGFKAARGDSEVAIDSALSGATGAISIVYLNLSSFNGESQIVALLDRAEKLEERARLLDTELQTRVLELKSAAQASNDSFGLDINIIRDKSLIDSEYTDSDIEAIAKNIQNDLWKNRVDIWTDGGDRGAIDLLDPPSAFHVLGYRFERAPFLGQIVDGGDVTEVAGLIDKPERYAAISEQFAPVVQVFTAAHELGHAILHKADRQFRDRGLDGSLIRGHRPQVEYEADKFAAYFLMPESVMRQTFRVIFGSDRFTISDNSAFSLGLQDSRRLLAASPTLRSLSLLLAKAGMFAGNPVTPIAELFGVSYEAMAIRIEELELIDPGAYRLDR